MVLGFLLTNLSVKVGICLGYGGWLCVVILSVCNLVGYVVLFRMMKHLQDFSHFLFTYFGL